MKLWLRRLSPLIPYAAVAIGIYCLGSAWVAIISYHIGMLLAVAFGSGCHDGTKPRRVSGWWFLSSLVFAMGGVALYLLWPYAFAHSTDITGRLTSLGISASIWPYFALYFCCANSLVEELFWRGYLGDESRGLVLNDLAFGGYHALVLAAFAGIIWALPVFVACVFAGWLWRVMRASSGNLVIPMLTHFVADAGIVAAVWCRIYS